MITPQIVGVNKDLMVFFRVAEIVVEGDAENQYMRQIVSVAY